MNAYFYSHAAPPPPSQATRTPRAAPPGSSGGSSGGGHLYNVTGTRPLSYPLSVAAATTQRTPAVTGAPSQGHGPPTRIGAHDVPASAAATPPAATPSSLSEARRLRAASSVLPPQSSPLPPRSAPTSSIPCLVLFTPQGPRPLEGLTTTMLSTAPGSALESSDVAGRRAALRNRALGLQKDAVAGGTRGPAHAPEGVRCVYDRDTRSQLLHISPGTEADFSACVRLPGYARGTSTGLPAAAAVAHTILAIQLCVAAPVRTAGERHRVGAVPEPSSPHQPLPGSVHVELVVRTGTSGAGSSTAAPTAVTSTTTITASAGSASSSSAGSYRLRFTNAITEVQRHAHHTRFPLRCVRTAQWVQLYMDIDSIMQACQPSSASARSAQRVVVRLHQLRIGTAAGGFSGGLYVRRIVAGHGLPLPPYPLLDHFVHAAGHHSMSAAAMAEAAGAAGVEEDAARGGWTLPEPLRLPVEAGETLSLFVRTGQEPVLRVPPSLPPPPPQQQQPSTPLPDAASTEEHASTHDNAENEEQIARFSLQRHKQLQPQQQQQRRHERVDPSAKTTQRASSPLKSPPHLERGESAGTKPRHHEPQTSPPVHAAPPLRQRAKITATTSIAAAPERRPYTALELLRQRQEDLESQQQRPPSRTSRRKTPLSSPPPQGAAYTPSAAQQSSSPPPRPSSQSTVEVFQVHEVPRASQLPWRTPPLRPPRGAAALNDAIGTPPMQQQAVCTPQDSPRPSEDGGGTASSATPSDSERWTVQEEEEELEESDDDVALQNQRRHTPPASVLPAFMQHTFDVSQLSEADDTAWAVASADSLGSTGSRHFFAPQAAAESAEKTSSLSASVTSAAAEELLEEVRERVARLHAVLADKNTGAAWRALPTAPSRPASAAVASVAAAAAPPLGTASTEEEKPVAVGPAETRPTPEPARARGSATPLSLMAAVVVGTDGAAHKEVLPTNTNTSSPPAPSPPPSAVPVRDAKAVLDLWSSSEVPLQLPAFAAQFTPQRKADKEKRFEKKEKEEERGDAAQPLREGTHPTERRAPGWLPVTSAAAEQPPPAITTAASDAAAAVNDAPPQPDSTATSWTFHSTSVAATATTTTTTTAVASGRGPAAAAAASALPRAGKTEHTKGDDDASGIKSGVANARPASAATKAVVWRRPSAGAAHHNTEKDDNVRDNNDNSIAPMRQVSGKSESHGGGLAVHRWKTPSTPPPLPPLSGAPPPPQAEASGVGGDGKGQSTLLSAALVPAAVAEINASEHAAVRTPTGQPPPPSAQRCGANNTSGSTASSFHMWLPHPMPVLVAAQARYPFFTTPSSGGHSRTSQTTHSDTNATTAVRRVGQPPVVRLSAVNGGGGDGGAAAHSSAMPSMKDERRNEADAAVVGYALSPSPAAAAAGAGALLLPPPHPPVRGEDVSQRYVYDCVLRCFLDTETNAYVDQVA